MTETQMPQNVPVVVCLSGQIAKVDAEQMMVFGWANTSSIDGIPVIDSQGDIIDESDLAKMAYDFTLNCRVGGEMHVKKGIGRLVESMVFTLEKQRALGIDLGRVAWWVGFKVDDPEVWAKVKSGVYKDFSIGGKGKRTVVNNDH